MVVAGFIFVMVCIISIFLLFLIAGSSYKKNNDDTSTTRTNIETILQNESASMKKILPCIVNDKRSLLCIAYCLVIPISKLIDTHPCDDRVLENYASRNITEEFIEVGHQEKAYLKLLSYAIGILGHNGDIDQLKMYKFQISSTLDDIDIIVICV